MNPYHPLLSEVFFLVLEAVSGDHYLDIHVGPGSDPMDSTGKSNTMVSAGPLYSIYLCLQTVPPVGRKLCIHCAMHGLLSDPYLH